MPSDQQADIRLNTEQEINQVLGAPPTWMFTVGSLLVFILTGVALGFTLIKYPETLPSQVTIISTSPAIRINSARSGHIEQLLVQHNQQLDSGTLLATFEAAAKYQDIMLLEDYLQGVAFRQMENIQSGIQLPQGLQLGLLGVAYAEFQLQLEKYQAKLNSTELVQKRADIQQQIAQRQNFSESLERQLTTIDQEFKLRDSIKIREDSLRKQNMNLIMEVDEAKAARLRTQREKERLQSEKTLNQLQIASLKSQLTNLQVRLEQELADSKRTYENSLRKLLAAITQWKENHLFFAPVSGKVILSKVWHEHQFVPAETEIMSLIPVNGKDQITARAYLPADRMGQLDRTKKVRLRLKKYPYRQFGQLFGQIDHISPLPEDDGTYLVLLSLPDTLKTDYGQVIPYEPELSGIAEFTTNERSLWQRITDRMLHR